MRWEAFLQRRQERRERARADADALRAGAPLTARSLAGWACAGDPTLLAHVEHALRAAALCPSPTWVRAALVDEAQLRPPGIEEMDVAERIHRRRLRAAQGPLDPLAWALDELAFLGDQVERHERAAWRKERYAAAPEDKRLRKLWKAWFDREHWENEEAWNRALLPHARRVFRAVMEEARVPLDARDRVIEDLAEGFYFQMLGGKDAVPGWLEVAARLVEGLEPEPIQALAHRLDDDGRARASRCAARRGAWADTVATLFPERVETEARANQLRTWWSPSRAEATVDLHVLLRLLQAWGEPNAGDPRGSWAIVTQNRGRARGRLRAVLMLGPQDALARAILDADALTARTAAAMRRYAWAWAWQQVEHRFDQVGSTVEVTPACPATPPPEPLDATTRAAGASWVLLLVLRGQLAALRAWVRTGAAQDGDTTLYRHLAETLPDSLRDPSGRTYHKLRTWLADALPGLLDAMVPLLADLASQPVDREIRARVTERLRPHWQLDEALLPRAGFPSLVRHAGVALTQIDPLGDRAEAALLDIDRVDAEEER